MNRNTKTRWAGIVLLGLGLSACGGGSDGGAASPTPPAAPTTVGAAGGTVAGPNGATLVIPPGALAGETAIAIQQTSAGSPPLPGGFSAAGAMFELTPHGTLFALPVTLTLPFAAASLQAGTTPQLFKTSAQNQWEPAAGATFGADTVSVQLTSFSWVQVNGLLRNDPLREWNFGQFPGDGQAEVPVDSGTLDSGVLDEIASFGSTNFDFPLVRSNETLPEDGIANGHVFSSDDGVSYSVMAQAPGSKLGTVNPIGSVTRLTQTQSFIKLSNDATLSFTVTRVLIDTRDFNPAAATDSDLLIRGEVALSVWAYSASNDFIFYTSGRAAVRGDNGFWIPSARDEAFSRSHLWNIENFNFSTRDISYQIGSGAAIGTCPGTQALLELKQPIPYDVDLSSVAVGEEFTLRTDAEASTNNRRGGGAVGDCQASSASAFLRDPLEIGGTALSFSGLQPTNRPGPKPTLGALVAPAACVPGPGPNAAAGVLQFDAASYVVGEAAGALSTVSVSRTGGSSGAVSATFTTSDGTATAAVDYTPVNATVFFGDGDVGPKVVTVPIVLDAIDEIDKTVNLALSQPGGCAALGAQTTAVLTIRDDDARTASPSGLDLGFGVEGKATSTEPGGPGTFGFGGDRSAMAVQADGKIVMVGGTFTDFILARFNADGSLDTGFGIDGKITTDMGGGPFEQEEALGVAIQADGKIVVVGHTSIPTSPPAPNLPPTFALARYNSDGGLDTSFGNGGKVSANVNGIAYAVAIQPDGKIVVAGEFSFNSSNGSDFSDFTLARFNADGTLDLGFGGSGTGQVATDIGSSTNTARNLVLQPNGAILVSGKPQGDQPGFDHTDVARYTADGLLDASFGSGGKLTIPGADVGQGLARQADGKFVLVGGVTEATVPATARFLLKRLNVDGSPDAAFGNAGTVDTAFTQSAVANGVALQRDGRIVVVGRSVFSSNANFIVARYNPNGSVDAGFGSDGNLSIDFFFFTDIGENVLVQSDGKILVSGQAQRNFDGYGLARINP